MKQIILRQTRYAYFVPPIETLFDYMKFLIDNVLEPVLNQPCRQTPLHRHAGIDLGFFANKELG
jgi:hypothetical protein